MKKNFVLLGLIIFIGLILRVVGLNIRPAGFTWDEAALGYNAYSLLRTGRDEYGQLAPVVFKSFGDYKPGLYIYFTVPSVKFLDLNEFSTRLPSALFGTIMIVLIFLLVRYLYPENPSSALLSTLVLSLNPWAIHFSRGAWEANLSLFLTVLGAVLFIRAHKSASRWHYLLAFLFFGLTFWSYQGAKLFTPLIVFSLLLIFRRNLKLTRIITPLLVSALFLLPIIWGFASQSGRLKVFSVFSYTRGGDYVSRLLAQDHTASKDWTYFLFHSELLNQLIGVYQRYLNHFSPRFLFIQGDWTSLRLAEYNQGYFYYPELVTLLMGIIYILRKLNRSTVFLLSWLFLAPVPSAFSRDLVSGVRSLPMLIPLTIFIGIGISRLLNRKFLAGAYVLLVGLFLVLYLDMYYLHNSYYSSREWVSAYKPVIQLIKPYLSEYHHVVMTDKLGQPYIFFLFYLKINPAGYQKQARLIAGPNGDVGQVSGFSQFRFMPVFWPSLRGQKDTIFIGDQYELPDKDTRFAGLLHLGDIKYPDGQPALTAVALK